jgi:hypothetical protein
VSTKIKPFAGERLSQARCNEQRAGDQATAEQIPFHDQHPSYRCPFGASHEDVGTERRYRTRSGTICLVQPGGAAIEVALLRQVRSSASRGVICVPSGARVTSHLQQVGSHRIQPMVLGEQLVAGQRF